MNTLMKYMKARACFLHLWMIAAISQAPLTAQLSEEIGRLIEAQGEVTIVTNDGSMLNAVTILATAKEQGVPIKIGNKVITGEYSSAIIQTLNDSSLRLEEMTSMQFGTPSRPENKKILSRLGNLFSFFTRQSGKEGDYRTDVVNTGWQDVEVSNESDSVEE